MAGAVIATGASAPPRWAPRALGTGRRPIRGTVDVGSSRRGAFPLCLSSPLAGARSVGRVASSPNALPSPASDARDACVFERGDVALLPNGARMRFVSRPDVQFLYDEIFADECYAKHGLAIREGATVIDVGGNIGMFALYAEMKAGAKGRVYALEPIPRTFAALRENVTRNAEEPSRVACLDAKDAEAALSSRRVSSSSDANVVAYNVGVSDGATSAATFAFYPRAAGWSSLAPDESETKANVQRFVEKRLSGAKKKARGGEDDDGDTDDTRLAALHPLASLGAKLLAFADGDDGDERESASSRTGRNKNGAEKRERAYAFPVLLARRLARRLARLAFSLAVGLVTAYLLGGKTERECPLVTVSDVIRANGLDRADEESPAPREDEFDETRATRPTRYAVDFLKIDVERNELATLRGIDHEHRGSIAQIAMETHDDESNGLRAVIDLLTAPTGAPRFGFGFERARVVAEQPDDLEGGSLWNVYARR